MSAGKVFGAVALIYLAIGVLSLLLGWPVKWIWNGVVVEAVNGTHYIGYWDAVCLNVLTGIWFRTNSGGSK